MTVSYNLDVSSASIISFLRLQLRWRGSIWKSVLKELIMFLVAFGCVSFVYRSNVFVTPQQRKVWDNFAALFDQTMDFIPLTFMLGFFVTIIVRRWYDIFENLGWVDNTSIVVANYIRGDDDKPRMIRRTVVRYLVLAQVLIFRDISLQVRRRFPTLESIVEAGFMLDHEKEKYLSLPLKYQKYFMPIEWSCGLLYEARSAGFIGADLLMNEMLKNIIEFRKGLAQLCNYDWVPIPLAYPQVVFLAVRSYFFMSLIARQSVLIDGQPPAEENPLYPLVPFFMSALQFVFVVGWMKVSESMINPLGEDDDDFECNFLLDRNLAVGLAIVDDCYNDIPSLEKDAFWSTGNVEPLYSIDTALIPKNPQVGSASNVPVVKDTEEVFMMPHMEDIDEFDLKESASLIPRKTFSAISINHPFGGSRMSLTSSSRKRSMMFDALSRKIANRPNNRATYNNSLSQSSFNFYNGNEQRDYNDEPQRKSSFGLVMAPTGSDNNLNGLVPLQKMEGPSNEALTTVIEEDEDKSKLNFSSHQYENQ